MSRILSSSESITMTDSLFTRLWRWGESALNAVEYLQPVAQLAARLYVGSVFFRSGLTKLQDWDTTLALFADEYKVPVLSPTVAAYLGTGGELVLPVLLAAGLLGRFAAAGLWVVNVVAVLSLGDMPPAALQGHVFWGSLLIGLVLWGPGVFSIDHWWVPRFKTKLFKAKVHA
jgi:putative oxidoreductase